MQITLTDDPVKVPSKHGDPSTRYVWKAADGPYSVIHLEQPAHKRNLLMVEQEGEAKSKVFAIGFQASHPVIFKALRQDLLLQLRKLPGNIDADDMHELLYELGGAYNKPMYKLKSFNAEVVYLDITQACLTKRMTKYPRVIPAVESIMSARRKRALNG